MYDTEKKRTRVRVMQRKAERETKIKSTYITKREKERGRIKKESKTTTCLA